MPRGIHGVRRVKAYQVDDAKGSLYLDLAAATKAARRAEFERRIKAWAEKMIGAGLRASNFAVEHTVKAILNDAGAAALNEAFKYYNGNTKGCQKPRRKGK